MQPSRSQYVEGTKSTYFNKKLAQAYLEEHGKHPKSWDDLVTFSKLIRGPKVLDIGCGPGHDSYKLAELGFDVIGFDYSPAFIEIAQNLHKHEPKPHFLIVDIYEMGKVFPANSFDAIYCNAVLLHLPKAGVKSIIRDMHAILKKGGVGYIRTSSSPQNSYFLTNKLGGKTFKRLFVYWQEKNLTKLLKLSGFIIKKIARYEGGGANNKPTTWLAYTIKK